MKFNWKKPRYWYHLSVNNLGHEFLFQPVENEANRDFKEPKGKRICVAPSIAHCLVAICPNGFMYIYRTKVPMVAKQASKRVWDAAVTKEGWFLEPTLFEKIGVFCVNDFRADYSPDEVKLTVCSGGSIAKSKSALSFLRKINLKKYIRKPVFLDKSPKPAIVDA